jgi:hypothetical protein
MQQKGGSMSDRSTGSDPASGGYTPDPTAEVRMSIDAFFNALVASWPDQNDLSERLRHRHENLLTAQAHRIVDEASKYNLALTLAVLAGYQELTSEKSDEQLLPILRSAFVEPLQPFVQAATRSALDSAPDPFAAMVSISKEREQYAFGAGFEFSHPEDDHDNYTAQVERCYYHRVLQANGAAQLTPIFCAFDANWINAIDLERDGFEFERPTTIGTGGANCPFRFRRRAVDAKGRVHP